MPSIELINMCYHLGDKMNMELKEACPALKEMPEDFVIYPIFQKENVEAMAKKALSLDSFFQ